MARMSTGQKVKVVKYAAGAALPAFDDTPIILGDRVLPVGWGDGVSLANSNTPATVVGIGRTRIRVRFDGSAYGGRFPEFDAAPSRHFRVIAKEA